MLPATPLLLAFIGASLALALTPGPAVVYIIARTLAQGRACGLASVVGVALGNLGNAIGAALGLAALFAISSAAFTVVKWAGAAYLIYLGVRMWRTVPAANAGAVPEVPRQAVRRVFRDGFVVALLNPKTTLFFAAFLPQFIDPARSLLVQFLLMASTFALVEILTELFIASAANRIRPWLQRVGKAFNRACGGVFMAIGVALPLRG